MTSKIVLVTGGSVGGIGFELGVQLLAQGHVVILGIRTGQARAAALEDTRSRALPGAIHVIELDVANEDSIKAAAALVEKQFRRLDALVNNAAIGTHEDKNPGSDGVQYARCFATNATGPFLMVEAFAPLLRKSSSTPRIINISSGAGSIRRILDRNSPRYKLHVEMGMKMVAYGASKAAMNLITAKQAVTYGEAGMKVFAYSPGFVASRLGPQNKIEQGAQPTDVAVAPIVKILDGERDAEHGCFLSADGQYEW